jgi:hypothetical protein
MIGSRYGIAMVGLPGLEWLSTVPMRARTVVRNAEGSAYFASGHPLDGQLFSAVARITPGGRIDALYPMPLSDNTAFALSRDETRLLAIDAAHLLHVLDAADLHLVRLMSVPFEVDPYVVVPLEAPGKAVVIGGTFYEAKVTGIVVDYRRGELGPVQQLDKDSRHPYLTFGYGNPWADIGGGIAVVPTRVGFVQVDLRTGSLGWLTRDAPFLETALECCEAAYDRQRDRLLVVSDHDTGTTRDANGELIPPGRLVIYRIRREGAGTE